MLKIRAEVEIVIDGIYCKLSSKVSSYNNDSECCYLKQHSYRFPDLYRCLLFNEQLKNKGSIWIKDLKLFRCDKCLNAKIIEKKD